MCGIAGMWDGCSGQTLRGMIGKLAHRGPDGLGFWSSNGKIGLGHCRLAIMDPAAGAQPLYNEDESVAMVANGEIYNYPRLRARLANRRHFRTGSDNEVIVHLFEERRAATVLELDGMFAFAISDGEEIYLARDAIGIKPLYVGTRQTGSQKIWLFASEMKALADVCETIHEFPPGSSFSSRDGWSRFYEHTAQEPEDRPLEEWLDLIRTTLEDAVVRRLMSDVPWGVFLSGGLDSSIIAALVRPHITDLHSFAVGVEGSPDLDAARLVARHLKTIHHEYVFTAEEARRDLGKVIYHLESFDQDLVRSALPCYYCSRLAGERVKVILTGEGADELMAGYDYHRTIRDPVALHRELHRSVSAMHNINLQRVDRMTMAHGLEGRVPFLDTRVIDLFLRIPVEWKLRDDGSGRPVEKWILRRAFEHLLPSEIVWRRKKQFDEGSGAAAMMPQIASSHSGQPDGPDHPDVPLRSAEERLYYRCFKESFANWKRLQPNVARWSIREPEKPALPPLMTVSA